MTSGGETWITLALCLVSLVSKSIHFLKKKKNPQYKQTERQKKTLDQMKNTSVLTVYSEARKENKAKLFIFQFMIPLCRHKNLHRLRTQFVSIFAQVPWILYWYRREKFNHAFAFRKSLSLFCTFTDCIHIANNLWFPICLAAKENEFESKSVRRQRNMSVYTVVQYLSTWGGKQSLNFLNSNKGVIDLIKQQNIYK